MALEDAWAVLKSAKEPTFWESLDEHEQKRPYDFMTASELAHLAAIGGGEGGLYEVVEYYLGEKRVLSEAEQEEIANIAIDRSIEEQELNPAISNERGQTKYSGTGVDPQTGRQAYRGALADYTQFEIDDDETLSRNYPRFATRETIDPTGSVQNPRTGRNVQVLRDMPWPAEAYGKPDFMSYYKAEFLKAPVRETGIPNIRVTTTPKGEKHKREGVIPGPRSPGPVTGEGADTDWGWESDPDGDVDAGTREPDKHQRIHYITPNKFLELAGKPAGNEIGDYSYYLDAFREAQEKNIPQEMWMPVLEFPFTDSPMGHDGRHRMAALRDMGYGDTAIPVRIGGIDAPDFGPDVKDDQNLLV